MSFVLFPGLIYKDIRGYDMSGNNSRARAVADVAEGCLVAEVELGTSPERVFQALASEEVSQWWVRPGVFDTREWTGDVRKGGRWRTAGMVRGKPYVLEGEFLDIEFPRKLVHSWHAGGAPHASTTVTYLLEPVDGGTRLSVRHSGFTAREACENTAIGWETSFERLAELLNVERQPAS